MTHIPYRSRRKYLVTADHVASEYRFKDEPVIVHGRSDGYWAQHPKLGCGKTYNDPEDAVWGLFESHACRSIALIEVPILAS